MRVGVLLSGCGVQDGSEVYEAVLTILALERGGAQIQAMAPDISLAQVINHYVGDEVRGETRSVLAESARIVRGKIVSTREVSAHDLDALVIVGGFGVTKNLCSFAADGVAARVQPDCLRLITELNALGKPIGAMCAAPILVALALRTVGKRPSLTVGTDPQTGTRLAEIGARMAETQVDEIHVDAQEKLVSTAAFMLAHSPLEAEPGISALCSKVLEMARENASATGAEHSGTVAASERTLSDEIAHARTGTTRTGFPS